MLNEIFVNKPFVSIGLWVLLYFSDRILTIAGARQYSSGANEHYIFPGGYELNPFFAKDVARLQWFSFNFFMALLLYGSVLLAFSTGPSELFAAAWGFLIFPELIIHSRHVRNLVLFYYAKRSEGVQGNVQVAHWLSLRCTAAEWMPFAVLLLFVYLISGNITVAGGAISCALLSARYMRRSIKRRTAEQPAGVSTASTNEMT